LTQVYKNGKKHKRARACDVAQLNPMHTMNLRQRCMHFRTDRPCLFQKAERNLRCGPRCTHHRDRGPRVCIVKLGALGDVVRTTAVLKPLWKRYGNPEVTWVTAPEARPVLENNPYVSHVVPLDRAWLLAAAPYDLLLNLDLDDDAVRAAACIPAAEKRGFIAASDGTVGCADAAAAAVFTLSHDDTAKRRNTKTYQRMMLDVCGLAAAKPADHPIILRLTAEERVAAARFAALKGISRRAPVIGVNTGGGDKWPRKEWTVENTIALIRRLTADGCTVILYGGSREKERNRRILAGVRFNRSTKGLVVDAGTENPLRQFFALVERCDLLVTTDSLALHVALGLGRRVVALFGPTAVREVELYGRGRAVQAPVDCVVCYDRACRIRPSCMEQLRPDTVYRAVRSQLGRR